VIFGPSAAALHDYSCEQILQACGFDLAASRSLSNSPNRHRLKTAALPRPLPAADPHHVQIIGPMESTSGLGQAARLSSNSLSKTGFSQSSYSFTLDNPAPIGFANAVLVSNLVYPAVNLIHLNAESIPLALAYMPDVFSGAYNIGYFFWELDSPAKCHSLALELLDEIWVSSQYGVDIYAPHTSKPVINVGMSFEKVPVVDRGAAREFLERRVGVKPGEFVFLTAFDSYSFIQRKNPQAVVRAFKVAFNQGEPVRLILKTHNKDFVCDPVQIRIWQALNEEIQSDHRIILMNETLQYDDLIKLKAGSDAYVSLHRSEGWGFGMVEAMNLGVPAIATNYSGNLEFCNEQTSYLVDYDLKALDHDDYIFVIPGQRWAEPRLQSAVTQMRLVFNDPALREQRSAAGKAYVQTHFSPEAVAKRYKERLSTIMAAQPPTPSKPNRKRRAT
jgi:glycosyltransferase involved in cell wall biosynthesis